MGSLSIGKESTFRAACEYKVICDTPAFNVQPYPSCHDANWGPAWPHIHHYGLDPSYTEGVIILESSLDQLQKSNGGSNLPLMKTIDIRFGRHRSEVNLLAKLHRNDIVNDFLDQYQRVTETLHETIFHITIPEPGNLWFLKFCFLLLEITFITLYEKLYIMIFFKFFKNLLCLRLYKIKKILQNCFKIKTIITYL